MVCYFFNLLDRVNLGFAALEMNKDLGFNAAVYGLGGSIFFVSYFLCEVPSNLALQKVGARRWIARIMISWGLVSGAMAFVSGETSFYTVRFLLGAAEAGFFPGVILYLTYWFPSAYRARIVATFMVSIPLASFLGSPLSAALLHVHGFLGLNGWQWLFLLEALPTVLLGIACLFVLTDRPQVARWLDDDQKVWLSNRLESERGGKKLVGKASIWKLLSNRHFLVMALVCSGASAAGTTLSLWQPQLLKSFGLTTFETGLVNAVPYGLACVAMVLWGRHSDKTGERRWHTAIPLACISVGLLATLVAPTLAATLLGLCLALCGAYSFKGPFWTLSSGWLDSESAAAGLAGINAASNLMGGGMVSLVGLIKASTGSYGLALLPLVALALLGSALLLWISSRAGAAAAHAD
ncbi:MFS transporter [Cupriavidus pauculus]|uniref:MFS transporter n=2 Tax=Cupriavidus pauculus TaxID=82633 RepID=A0A2N5CD72_9BURK|nr:MFS transporter [Cupriavidus pauculus]